MKQNLVHGDSGVSTPPRTPLDEAIKQILKHLTETGKQYSIAGLARETGLHRNTVNKSIELLDIVEKKCLDNYRLTFQRVDNRRFITLVNRVGLLSYPEEIQKMIITTKHYPTPSAEEQLLVFLYLKHAISAKKSIPIPERGGKLSEEMITKLTKQGQIKEIKGGKLFLTNEGIIVAKGALKLYPSLENI